MDRSDFSSHAHSGRIDADRAVDEEFLPTPERSFKRKIKELIMAYITETKYSKDDILRELHQRYLSRSARAGRGIYGIWEASEYYFSKEPRDLSIGEMATIAGMISSPNRLNPMRHPDLAKDSPQRGARLDAGVRLPQPARL